MLTKNPAFLGQIKLLAQPYSGFPQGGASRGGSTVQTGMPVNQGYPPFPPPLPSPYAPPSGGVCPAGKMPFSFADRTVCVDSGHFAVAAAGAEVGPMRPPGTPQIQPPIEYQPPMIEDIGPEMPPPVESRDDFYPYGTGQAPAGEGGCPPGQYRPTWSARCVPKGDGGFGGFGGYGGIINMGPSGGVPFTMGRAMLGRVRLVRRPY